MSDNMIPMLQNAIELQLPNIDLQYSVVIEGLLNEGISSIGTRTVFELKDLETELSITFKHLGLVLQTKKRILFLDDNLEAKMSFNYSEDDEIKSLIDFYIDMQGMIRIDDAMHGELLNPKDFNNFYYALFGKIAGAAYKSKLISF